MNGCLDPASQGAGEYASSVLLQDRPGRAAYAVRRGSTLSVVATTAAVRSNPGTWSGPSAASATTTRPSGVALSLGFRHEGYGVDLDRRLGQDEAGDGDCCAGRELRAEDLSPHLVVALVAI